MRRGKGLLKGLRALLIFGVLRSKGSGFQARLRVQDNGSIFGFGVQLLWVFHLGKMNELWGSGLGCQISNCQRSSANRHMATNMPTHVAL